MERSSKPLVSVVIPSYERPELVEKAVKSVMRQTYNNLEINIIDDHSPTPVRESLDDDVVVDDKVNFVRLDENRGANAARNIGIRKSSGKYIAFLDDDDRWFETKVQRQIDAFDQGDAELGVVLTGVMYIDSMGMEHGVHIPSVRGNVTKGILEGSRTTQFSTVMVRSDVIDRCGLLDERFPSWQDREWYIRLSQYSKFESIQEPLVKKLVGDHNQIGDDYESKRDVSYPLLLRKHRGTAKTYGVFTDRRFVAAHSYRLGRSAMRNGYYTDARKYLLYSFLMNPFHLPTLLNFVAVIGGEYTHELSKYLGRKTGII